MGLDMYLKRITRLTDEEKKYADEADYETLDGEYCLFRLGDDGEPDTADNGLDDVMPYLHVVKKGVKCIDFKKWFEKEGIPQDARFGMSAVGVGERWWMFHANGQDYRLDWMALTDKEREELTVTETRTYGVCKMDEVAYWRKSYSLQEALCNACDVAVENCGYYRLNDEIREVLRENGCDEDLHETDDSIVCYHEWY